MRSFSLYLLVGAALVIASSAAVGLPIWSNAGWIPYTSGGQYYWDPLGDVAPSGVDLIGTDPLGPGPYYPTLYWFLDDVGTVDTSDDVLMFRMRLDGLPGGNVYVIAFDTDGDPTNVDWVLQVDLSSDNQVELQEADPGGPNWGDVNIPKPGNPDNNPYEWTGSVVDWSRIVDISTEVPGYVPLNGTTDYFLDMAIPWQDFASIVGFNQPIRLAALTSQQHSNLNKDKPDDPVGIGFGDPIIPEPSTMALLGLGLAGLIMRRRKSQASK